MIGLYVSEMLLKEQLAQYDGTTEMVESCLNLVRESEKVIIFGAGVGGSNSISPFRKK